MRSWEALATIEVETVRKRTFHSFLAYIYYLVMVLERQTHRSMATITTSPIAVTSQNCPSCKHIRILGESQ